MACLISAGKDSALSLHRIKIQGHDVTCLVSMIPGREDSWMFHYPNIQLVDLFSKAAGIPLVKKATSGIKEEEIEDLVEAIAGLKIDGLVSGAIASVYQKTRIENVCERLGLKCMTPLWHADPLEILHEIVRLGFDVMIAAVSAYGFSVEWLGRRMDFDTINDMVGLNRKFEVSLVGEGGEYETLVLDAPFFNKRIKIIEAEKVWKGQSGCYLVRKAELASK